MRVLALDPGDKVGWARCEVDAQGNWSEFRHGITPLWETADDIARAMTPLSTIYDVIVIEDWRLYATHARTMVGSSFPSVQFIGAVKFIARQHHKLVVMQGAGVKKTALAAMEHDRPDLYELCTRTGKHDDLHDQDAIMHLYIYLRKQEAKNG